MNEWVKTLVTSGVVAAVVSWLATSYKIEQEFHIKQGEAGYEALVKGNALFWQSTHLKTMAKLEKDEALATRARELEIKSEALHNVARQKIATFGDERVVKAMSDYYSNVPRTQCDDKERFRLDTQIYKAIRNTLGVGGNASDEQLAVLLFLCTLR